MRIRMLTALAGAALVLAIIPSTANAAAANGDDTLRSVAATAMRPLQSSDLIVENDSASGNVFTVTVSAQRYAESTGAQVAPAVTPKWVCTLQSRYPHYSSGSGGVIAKIAVTCGGPIGTLPIQVYGLLGRGVANQASALQIVRESNYTQNVVVNGGEKIWYVPALGAKGAQRNAWFRSSASAKPQPPLIPFNIAAHYSPIVFVE